MAASMKDVSFGPIGDMEWRKAANPAGRVSGCNWHHSEPGCRGDQLALHPRCL